MRTTVTILHNIRSIHNVASMFRTADGAGVAKLYLTGITPGPLDRFENPVQQFVKVSLGAEQSVAWEKHRSIAKIITALKTQGYYIVAVEQHTKSIPFNKAFKQNKIALIMGNEPDGLPSEVLKKCDAIMEIPMRGKKESLNVSVAFGIVAYAVAGK